MLVSRTGSIGALPQSALIGELRQATYDEQLQLFYQPIFQLQPHPGQPEHIIGVEALLRWHHPRIGSIGPREFLPMIETTDYIHELETWVLRQACLQVQDWHQQGWGSLGLNVNVSVRQLEQTHVLNQVLKILAETGLRADLLTLELTDTEMPHTCQTIRQLLAQLRQQGIQVRLDHVGAGSLALQAIEDLPVDGFKVDQLLVSHNHCQSLTKLMKQAEQRGLSVVVAGIETLDQLEYLRGLGCTLGQGYLLSPPLDPSDMERLLHRSTFA
ncbi:MAG: EAL domain-containing protein [Synechococcaceae cyanobacterium RM1_1_27]|nr:EAL domain-containing protein [Synechococcaceae cyanobacterium RM1_1_27]